MCVEVRVVCVTSVSGVVVLRQGDWLRLWEADATRRLDSCRRTAQRAGRQANGKERRAYYNGYVCVCENKCERQVRESCLKCECKEVQSAHERA